MARILRSPKFRVVASGSSLAGLNVSAVSQYDARLLVIESSDVAAMAIKNIVVFKQENPSGRVAVLGRHWQPSEIVAAFQAGANVYFAEVTASDEFIKALELVMMGQTILPMELLSLVSSGESSARLGEIVVRPQGENGDGTQSRRGGIRLSTRENAILSCISRGASNKMIAREIEISEATVKVHVKTILRKIGVSNRTQAAIWAMGKCVTSRGEKLVSPPSSAFSTDRPGDRPQWLPSDGPDSRAALSSADHSEPAPSSSDLE
jgi:two-component system nitrate/nitrite response regulator NarL